MGWQPRRCLDCSERVKMGLFGWKKKTDVPVIGFEERIRSQGKPSKTLSYDLQGRQADAVRRQHPYLFHVTDLPSAEAIVTQRLLYGAFAHVTLSQGLQGALSQAERTGCVLVFRFQGQAVVGMAPARRRRRWRTIMSVPKAMWRLLLHMARSRRWNSSRYRFVARRRSMTWRGSWTRLFLSRSGHSGPSSRRRRQPCRSSGISSPRCRTYSRNSRAPLAMRDVP